MEVQKGPHPGRHHPGFGLAGSLAVETNSDSRVPGGASRWGDQTWPPPLSLWAGLSTGFLGCLCRGQRGFPPTR